MGADIVGEEQQQSGQYFLASLRKRDLATVWNATGLARLLRSSRKNSENTISQDDCSAALPRTALAHHRELPLLTSFTLTHKLYDDTMWQHSCIVKAYKFWRVSP